jgi:hypothetical protein
VKVDLSAPVTGIVVDLRPDERGNLMAAALVNSERRIALTMNAN